MESRKNQNKFYVYGLINPIDDKLFYIGKGTGYRYKAHLHTQSLENSSLKNNKIKSIINSGKEPIYKIFAKDLYENEINNEDVDFGDLAEDVMGGLEFNELP